MPWRKLCLKKGESEDWYRQTKPEHKATAYPEVFAMARGLCVKSESSVRGQSASATGDRSSGCFCSNSAGCGTCCAFSLKLQSILYVCLCVPGHTEEQCVAVKRSPSLHMGLSPWSL